MEKEFQLSLGKELPRTTVRLTIAPSTITSLLDAKSHYKFFESLTILSTLGPSRPFQV